MRLEAELLPGALLAQLGQRKFELGGTRGLGFDGGYGLVNGCDVGDRAGTQGRVHLGELGVKRAQLVPAAQLA